MHFCLICYLKKKNTHVCQLLQWLFPSSPVCDASEQYNTNRRKLYSFKFDLKIRLFQAFYTPTTHLKKKNLIRHLTWGLPLPSPSLPFTPSHPSPLSPLSLWLHPSLTSQGAACIPVFIAAIQLRSSPSNTETTISLLFFCFRFFFFFFDDLNEQTMACLRGDV